MFGSKTGARLAEGEGAERGRLGEVRREEEQAQRGSDLGRGKGCGLF